MKIDYYANGCGTGKTTKLKKYIDNHQSEKILVIVPGIELAKEYKDYGKVVIGQEGDRSVLVRINEALNENEKVLIITSAAFEMSTFKDRLVRDRIVIQDESLDVVDAKKWKLNNHPDWIPVFQLSDLNNGWHKVTFDYEQAQHMVNQADSFDDFKSVKDILATPKEMWASNTKFDEHTTFFTVISPSIYEGAKKVIVACANFEQTFQYKVWQAIFNVEFNALEAFQPYKGKNTHIHFACQKTNSIIYNRKNPSIRHAVIDYTIKNSKGAKVVVVDNGENQESLPREWAKVKHNCHGVNEHRNAKHIAFLSAINFDNLRVTFMKDICGMEPSEVEAALLGEMAHQVLMRGALRMDNDAECHFYLMAQNIAFHLAAYLFVNAQIHAIPNTEREEQAKAVLAPLKQTDRNKANHIKKNYPAFNNMDTRALMNHIVWDLLNDRGGYSKTTKGLLKGGTLKEEDLVRILEAA